jgi:glycosyltransferase involved in cell wall biosynthesis
MTMPVLSKELSFSQDVAPLPDGFSEQVYECSRKIDDPETARHLLEELRPLLSSYRADRAIAVACGLLLEKQRSDRGMREVWNDLQRLYPKDSTSLRMLMRWYRRENRVEAGIAHMKELFPRAWHSPAQACQAILGLSELKAWVEIDRIMETILFLHPEDRRCRMAYIKALSEQCRFIDAARIAEHVLYRERMGQASQDLLISVERNARTLSRFGRTNTAAIIDDILACARTPRPFTAARRLVFFTGQLGTGGAERQMTRLACAFQKRLENGQTDSPESEVWVKHTNVATGADFYLPSLQDAGVPTRILTDIEEAQVSELEFLSDDHKDLIELLAPDVRRHTCQLTKLFREHQTDVAYLWQDGGIVQSAIAAVLAGVPRIVTSFRGLPPNLRPNFYRDELPVLYSALAKLPHVTFTANSQKAAIAYEDWLSLAPGTVAVIPNAIPALMPDGDQSDYAFWSDIVEKSPTCTKTVLGVFRMDANKRPLQWIEAAARHLKKNPNTRFVILGGGILSEDCEKLIAEKRLSDRVFLAGVRSNVGFYMHRADLLMHLAEMEGLPNVLIEAQIVGTPVLATPAGGTDEVVCNGETGILLSDAATLPEAELDARLTALLSDDAALARLSAAAKEHSRERFSVETILDKTISLFRTLEQRS